MDDLIARRNANMLRVRQELAWRIREAGLSRRELEASNGFGEGRLDAVLDGDAILTVQHFYGILMALRVVPSDFFKAMAERYDLSPEPLAEAGEAASFLDDLDLIDQLRSGS